MWSLCFGQGWCVSSGCTLYLPSVGHISANESSSDTPCQKKFIPYLYHDRYHSTLPRLYHVPYYLSVPVGTDNSWPGIVNDNVFGCLGTVLICSLRLSVTTENLGDHVHGRLWVESRESRGRWCWEHGVLQSSISHSKRGNDYVVCYHNHPHKMTEDQSILEYELVAMETWWNLNQTSP